MSVAGVDAADRPQSRCVFFFSHTRTVTQRGAARAAYTYVSIGCSKAAEHKMLDYARKQVGKPFSNYGMARSLMFPRKCTDEDFFCAELVARCLIEGGLMDRASNPSSATPSSLFELYSSRGAATGNPFVLRNFDEKSIHFNATSSRPLVISPPTVPRRATTPAPTSIGSRSKQETMRSTNDGAPITLSFQSLTFRR